MQHRTAREVRAYAFAPQPLARQAVGVTPLPVKARRSVPSNVQPLTAREREILALVAEGRSNKIIAATLGLSEQTIKNHLTSIMMKLRAEDRTHAVVTAIRLGWLDV